MTAPTRRPPLPARITGNPARRLPAPDMGTDKPRLPEENLHGQARTHAHPPARPLPRRTGAPYRRPEPEAQSRNHRAKRRFVQLVACLVVFGAALLIKIIAPESAESIKQTFAETIGGGMDYKAAFSTVGQALSGGEGIDEVWKAISAALFGEEEAQVGTPEQSEQADTPVAGTTSVTDGAPQAPPTGRTLNTVQNNASVGAPVLQLSGWEVSLSEADALDDTAPVPFGLAVPVNVDYTPYELPFETAQPVSGPMSSDFGYRDHPISGEMLFHYGLDIAAPTGTDIRCFADGTVTAVGDSNSYGKYIQVRHDGTYATFYAHCSKILAQEGQHVKKGDVIARVGMTGAATGPHLHLEIRCGDTLLDPKYCVSTETTA